MNDKAKRNELLITLNDLNNIISKLEHLAEMGKATDSTTNQLLYAYDIKIKLLNSVNM